MRRVLFLCTGNSARSQMAEALLRHLSDSVEVASAGTAPKDIHPLAVGAMRELGIDISRQRSKALTEYLGQPFDYVITLCDDANESCPTFPNATTRLHFSFEDPARVQSTRAEQFAAFRRVRDELHDMLTGFASSLED